MSGKSMRTIVRDARKGQFTKKENAKQHPDTTVTATVKMTKKGK